MHTAAQAYERCRSVGEEIRNDQPQRFPDAASDGDCWRQGDLYIIRRDRIPSPCLAACATAPYQLADGTTKGARHLLENLTGVSVFVHENPNALQGPVLVLTEERTVTHPEHGDVILPPGIYEIRYQRAFATELRRVAD